MVVKQTHLKIPFDGGENEQKWMAYGMPRGKIPDQYVKNCEGEGRNLHIYHLGWYHECNYCEHQKNCKESAACAGEQAEG